MSAALAWLLATCVLALPAAAEELDARVVSARGLTITPPGGDSRPGRARARIPDGSMLHLEEGGTAEIEVGDHKVFLGPARTVVRLRGGALREVEFTLFEGMSRHVVDEIDANGAYRVITPTATAGVRGTVFTSATGADGAGYVGVEEGEVEVEDPQGHAVTAEAGSAYERAPGGSIEEAPLRDEEGVSAWNLERRAALEEDPEGVVERMGADARAASASGREALAAVSGILLRVGAMAARGGDLDAGDVEEALEVLAEGLRILRASRLARARLEVSEAVARRAAAVSPGLDVSPVAAEASSFSQAYSERAEDLDRLATSLERLSGLIRIARMTRPLRNFPIRFGF